ncbi:hypothetical protein QCA50_006197 [Cerrena zonata]|uniref:Uncharacterized protein n=1 Tax=Cerrena zonata TaxID=2478898 RepID=A0AAW0GH57_9APHY
MLLSPSTAPPSATKEGHSSPKSLSVTRSSSSPLRVLADKTNGSTHDNNRQETVVPRKFKIPAMILDTESISTAMAARLASSLIGHVLFLKSQIPFPVAQLSRMSNSSNNKASKKREEFINAIDTLSSHLITTFAALSTAFDQRGTIPSLAGTENANKSSVLCSSGKSPLPAHLAIVLGPSVGAAKARVMFVVDGLEVKTLGAKETTKESASRSPSPSLENEETSSSDSESEYQDCEESQVDSCDSESGSEPPLSRSPSPCPSEASSGPETACEPTPVPPPVAPKFVPFCETPSAPPPRTLMQKSLPLSTRPSPLQQSVSVPGRTILAPRVHESPLPSFEEEQQTLRAGDRLLSRTLANACAEDDGGISAELASTQMHILIRAPRRFNHPAWVPKQNLTRSLENTLDTFLKDSIIHEGEESSNQKKRAPRVGIKTEGVWVGCKAQTSELPSQKKEDGELSDEEDEMIWWAWDGKIAGFSEW